MLYPEIGTSLAASCRYKARMNISTFLILWYCAFPPVQVYSPDPVPVVKDTLMIPVLDYDQLKPILNQDNDTTYVFNFWATWCMPCVKEIPYFQQLDSIYRNEAFRLVFVSLDFKKDYLRKLQPFALERGLERQVLILEDNDSNFWISDIDSTWSGSLPATLIVSGKQRAFYERTFQHVGELSDLVKPYLNQ